MFQRYDLRRNFPNGDKYNGEATDDNVKDGRGTYFWAATGATYVGMWKKDQMNGAGELTIPGADGYKYCGPFVKGQRHGRAVCTFNNGSVYNGDWINGVMHGAGELTRPAVQPPSHPLNPEEHDEFVSFVGTFRDNRRDGPSCRIVYVNGSEYTGAFEDDVRHGIGRIQFAPSNASGSLGLLLTSYEGEFTKGRASGVGRLIWRSGDCYEGQVVDYVPNGDGSVTRGSKAILRGRFLDGKLHGRGSSWSDDRIAYTGEFQHGQWHGEGHYVCADITAACDSKLRTKQFVLDYRGRMANGQFNATPEDGVDGLAHYASGETYHGNFLDDRRHGKGRQENAPIAVPGAAAFRLKYTGEFVRDMREGHGTGWFALPSDDATSPTAAEAATGLLCYARCGTYTGTWRQDLPNGRGAWEWDNGTKYEGFVVDFYPDCDSGGTFSHRQWQYVGGFHKGQRYGKGRVQYCNGDVYDGSWKANQYDGAGSHYTAVTGDTYSGEWVGGKKHGKGTEVIYGMAHYEGEFADGLRHGYGVLKHSQPESKYTGNFALGEFCGQGLLCLSDGTTFSGQFEGGQCHGHCEASFPNGNKYSGEFRRGEIHGLGEMKYANGDRYTGQLAPPKAQRHGGGIFYFSDGTRLECTWSRNVLHGEGVHTDRHGVKTVRAYFEGSLVAPQGVVNEQATGDKSPEAKQRGIEHSPSEAAPQSTVEDETSMEVADAGDDGGDGDRAGPTPPTPARKVVALSLGAIVSPPKGPNTRASPSNRASSVSSERLQRENEIASALSTVQSLTASIHEITQRLAEDMPSLSEDEVPRLQKRLALLRATRLRETRRLLSLQEL